MYGCAEVPRSESADWNGSDVLCRSSVLLQPNPLKCVGKYHRALAEATGGASTTDYPMEQLLDDRVGRADENRCATRVNEKPHGHVPPKSSLRRGMHCGCATKGAHGRVVRSRGARGEYRL